MADTSGQQDIRGIDIDKIVRGARDEAIIFKRYCGNTTTKAREIRWFQRTAGFVTGPTTTGITSSQISLTAEGSIPVSAGQSWTRKTSYVKYFKVESEMITDEDIRDNDVDLFTRTVKDLVRAVGNQVDTRIWNTITENQSASNINSTTTTSVGGDQWDAASYGGDPIADILDAQRQIRENSYEPMNGALFLSPKDYQSLVAWLIAGKGSSIPEFASEKVQTGVVMRLLGLDVVVNTAVTADFAGVFSNQAATWKAFTQLSSTIINYPGIGRKIRVVEEGECILHDPKAVTLIIDTQT